MESNKQNRGTNKTKLTDTENRPVAARGQWGTEVDKMGEREQMYKFPVIKLVSHA